MNEMMKDDTSELVRTYTIRNKLGLHARAASMFVQVANKFDSEIYVSKNDQEVNGKSIMGILILAAPKGSDITIKAVGGDALSAVDALGELIEDGFGED
ncbi:MAG TPA: HPr family phosphocarrier protein [Thermodesulfobacteriota bacterium]|nr:HPr family phosphocarrier protein [Thermodesulfobacteriota bacterium]